MDPVSSLFVRLGFAWFILAIAPCLPATADEPAGGSADISDLLYVGLQGDSVALDELEEQVDEEFWTVLALYAGLPPETSDEGPSDGAADSTVPVMSCQSGPRPFPNTTLAGFTLVSLCLCLRIRHVMRRGDHGHGHE